MTGRAGSAPKLQRIAFTTSRLAEFCGQKELTAQTGHAPDDWPLVIAKELIDNALDACEEAEIAPKIEISVSTDRGEIVVVDNGPGLPPDTIEGVLDYSSRVSSREAYVSPTRGAQGNALKTIVAMPFALDGARGITVIEARGGTHRIIFEMDPVRREPRVFREISASNVQNGTRITVHWPKSACSMLEDARDRFVQIAETFEALNPHLALSVDWNGEQVVTPWDEVENGWRKWRACDPTSADWYDVERFGRYIAAHIARDEDRGHSGRTVRDFVSELRGISRSDKQAAVLAEVNASGVPLARFFKGGEDAVRGLLRSCKNHTKAVDPKDLGLIGADHLRWSAEAAGADADTFRYKKLLGTRQDGLPYAVEAAFAYCPEARGRCLVTGVNFSSGIRNPFNQLGFAESLSALLASRHAGYNEPIVFFLHYTCPRIDYTDRGKSMISLPWSVGSAIKDLAEKVTKDWYAQRRREEKEASRRQERRDRLTSAKKASIKDAAWSVMEEAYAKASDGGKLPAKPRQIMYAARPRILALTGKETLKDAYFTQTLLVNYINANPGRCADWDIVWDARGTFTEPHTGIEIPLGTLEVRQYLGERPAFGSAVNIAYDTSFPTKGPENRFETILFVEKEGFGPLLAAVNLAARYDISIMSTKGMSTTAARLLIDRLIARGVKKILVLHDFDISGFSIFGTLGTSNRRYRFKNDTTAVVNIGLRLNHVKKMSLESEPVIVKGNWNKRVNTLKRHGAEQDEIDFLRNRRVELNAMTSRQLVDFIEAALEEHGVEKVVPGLATLQSHARRLVEVSVTRRWLDRAADDIAKQAAATKLPADLEGKVREVLRDDPELSWDAAVARIIR